MMKKPLSVRRRDNFEIVNKQPPLENLIRVHVKPIHRDYVTSMLKLIGSVRGVTWSKDGDLISPVTGLNIVKILNTFSQYREALPASEIPSVKLLLKLVDISKDFIKNPVARKQLFPPTALPPPPPPPPPPPHPPPRARPTKRRRRSTGEERTSSWTGYY